MAKKDITQIKDIMLLIDYHQCMCEIIYLNTSTGTCFLGFNGFKIGFIWKKY